MRLPPTATLIRAAVVLAIFGMLALLPILIQINALNVGLVMLGSLLVVLALLLYVAAVVRDLRRSEVL